MKVNELSHFLQIPEGTAAASLQIADLDLQLQKQRKNQALSELMQKGSQLYLGVFVTNVQSKVLKNYYVTATSTTTTTDAAAASMTTCSTAV